MKRTLLVVAVFQLVLLLAARPASAQNPLETDLLVAAENGDTAEVRRLLDKGVNVNIKDKSGYTSLMHTQNSGRSDTARLLLEKGAVLNADDETSNALLRAAAEGRADQVKVLLEKGANIEVRDLLAWTPLIWAAWQGRPAVVKLLVDKGANIEAEGAGGGTALTSAAEARCLDVLKLLLEKGSNVEAKPQYPASGTALTVAAEAGFADVVRLLLAKGADIEAKDSYGNTAPKLARENHHAEVVQILYEVSVHALKSKQSREDHQPATSPAAARNEEGMQLMKEKNYEAAAAKSPKRLGLIPRLLNAQTIRVSRSTKWEDTKPACPGSRRPSARTLSAQSRT